MANPTGEMRVTAKGKSYRLHLGMSVLADLQEQYGERLEAILSPPDPADGDEKPNLPDLKVMHAVFLGALQRYHAAEADRWLVDDIIAENENAWGKLLTASSPDPQEGDKPRGKRKAAA
ncbi:hypothetical protein [Pelagibacterium sp.]|uniref:hypothetical protein n=1 Tax=Pelagibacterium sp. TaxID=1967288 RepID=UPI003A9152EC